jgi:hypothetical protein
VDLTWALLRGLVIGFAIAAAIGPIGLLHLVDVAPPGTVGSATSANLPHCRRPIRLDHI